jgi:hypothetical protein
VLKSTVRWAHLCQALDVQARLLVLLDAQRLALAGLRRRQQVVQDFVVDLKRAAAAAGVGGAWGGWPGCNVGARAVGERWCWGFEVAGGTLPSNVVPFQGDIRQVAAYSLHTPTG